MKIKGITFINNPVLKDLFVSFCNSENEPVDTIILAGENGTGKSVILNAIYEFSTLNSNHKSRNEKRHFEIELNDSEMTVLRSHEPIAAYFQDQPTNNILAVRFNYSLGNAIASLEVKRIVRKIENDIPSSLFNSPIIKPLFKSIFCDVGGNLNAQNIRNVTSKDLDVKTDQSQKSTSNISTEIAQLLIDIQTSDALHLTEWIKRHPGKAPDKSKIDIRLNRFKEAFDFMFPDKKLLRVENLVDRKEIIFEERGLRMNINQLSSGEKQIVFRGGFLLKDRNYVLGSLVLVDEPEVSLHPKWQLKILEFYKRLFTNDEGKQVSQLFISTHSPFLIHNHNRNDDKVIVLKKDDTGKISIANDPKFYGWSDERIIEAAFDIKPQISNDANIVYVEGITDEKYYNKCIEIFERKDLPFKIKRIGRDTKGGDDFSGKEALDKFRKVCEVHPHLLKKQIILLYDPENLKITSSNSNLIVKSMLFNSDNDNYFVGIENLFTIIPEIEVKKFTGVTGKKIDTNKIESPLYGLEKTKLCNFICDTLDKENQKVILKKLNDEIDSIIGLIK